jgi:nitrogen-specific signal transduction histidine kinase
MAWAAGHVCFWHRRHEIAAVPFVRLWHKVTASAQIVSSGIPAHVREKMFNPFFTTKPSGEGTGLKLSISHDIIVKQHGGSIEVDTVPGEFAEFRMILPRSTSKVDRIFAAPHFGR